METSSSVVEPKPQTPPPNANQPTSATATDKPKALEVPLNADGSIGELPKPLQELFDRTIVKRLKEVKEKTALDPVERERLKQLEEENQRFLIEQAEKDKRYDEAKALIEKNFHDKAKKDEDEKAKYRRRLQDMLSSEVRSAASKLGARNESLGDIAVILKDRLAMDDDLNPVILDEHGKAIEGLTIEQLVAQTLEAKPYFKDARPSGGGARGGASLSGHTVTGIAAAEQKALADAEAEFNRSRSDRDLQNVIRAKQALDRAIRAAQK